MASSSSSSRESRRSQVGSGEQQAPVPYRVGPYAYWPPVMCQCNQMAPCWIAWSDENPGRRYYRCRYGLTPSDCGFFRWIDRQATPYERTLLCDMRDAIRQMKREKAEEEQQM
ncbi:hypothetical protein PVAP13_2KG209000 [Panicum virgatum]|uniref:GRF-type domain-containing protein n=1 Tax=Panicum virgatum TaxID=38727 RepID=A0A8T0WHS7_PANVG|nr:hypothetical protein PVAP13_2KG209000 [Panicum virgatum]